MLGLRRDNEYDTADLWTTQPVIEHSRSSNTRDFEGHSSGWSPSVLTCPPTSGRSESTGLTRQIIYRNWPVPETALGDTQARFSQDCTAFKLESHVIPSQINFVSHSTPRELVSISKILRKWYRWWMCHQQPTLARIRWIWIDRMPQQHSSVVRIDSRLGLVLTAHSWKTSLSMSTVKTLAQFYARLMLEAKPFCGIISWRNT